MEERRCDRCVFWSLLPYGSGECRRHAPVIRQGDDPVNERRSFPVVYAHEWCGDFEQKEGK